MANIKQAQIEVDEKIKKYIMLLELRIANLTHALEDATGNIDNNYDLYEMLAIENKYRAVLDDDYLTK